MSCIEIKVKLANSIVFSKRIKRNWNWLFNYDHHDLGRIWVGWDPNHWIVTPLFQTFSLTNSKIN